MLKCCYLTTSDFKQKFVQLYNMVAYGSALHSLDKKKKVPCLVITWIQAGVGTSTNLVHVHVDVNTLLYYHQLNTIPYDFILFTALLFIAH